VQKVIASENLLENCRAQGDYLSSLLRERLQGPNSPAAPYTFDIRGGGGFWGVEFDFAGEKAAKFGFKPAQFPMLVQARTLEKARAIDAVGMFAMTDAVALRGS
jgi:E3 ubiquitin-protein ligase TRIP12